MIKMILAIGHINYDKFAGDGQTASGADGRYETAAVYDSDDQTAACS